MGPQKVLLYDRWSFIRDTNVEKYRNMLLLKWSLITVFSHGRVHCSGIEGRDLVWSVDYSTKARGDRNRLSGWKPIIILYCRYFKIAQYSRSSLVSLFLFHTMACYMIYMYVFSERRSIRPVEIDQYDITMATHYDITMGNDVARDAQCEITMVNDVARDIHCDITISNNITMCRYQGITMLNDVSINLFYYVFFALCLIVLFYYR